MELERRHIRLEGSSNLRDIGGYPTADGMRVKWGRVFRSGSLWGLTAADWQWMDAQGFAVLCDLRSDAERELAPTIWQGRSPPPRTVDRNYDGTILFDRGEGRLADNVGAIESQLYLKFATLLAPSIRGFFQALQEGEAPAVVHCTAGQDRTGLAVSLLLGALGVDRETIYADYLLSPQLRRPDRELDRNALASRADSNAVAAYYSSIVARLGPDAFAPKPLIHANGKPLVDLALTAIEKEWGSVENYVEAELGMGQDQLVRLRTHLLEPA